MSKKIGNINYMKKMKTYQKMPAGQKTRRKNLPRVVERNLKAWIDAGLILKTNSGHYMKPSKVDQAASAYKKHLAKQEQPVKAESPPWVEAAEEAVTYETRVSEDPVEEISEGDVPASALSVFTLSLGNRAAAIIQMCDALASGQATLGVLQDIRGQGLMILGDLNLLQPVEGETEVS